MTMTFEQRQSLMEQTMLGLAATNQALSETRAIEAGRTETASLKEAVISLVTIQQQLTTVYILHSAGDLGKKYLSRKNEGFREAILKGFLQ